MNMLTFYKEESFKETPIGNIPEDWEVVKLKSIAFEVKKGFACGKRDENGILQLRMDSIDPGGWINVNAGVRVPIPKNVDEYILHPGDILFNNTNSVDLIGKTAIFRGEFHKCVYSNHITRIRVNSDVVLPEWILYTFIRKWRLGFFKAICHRHVHQAGISDSDLLNIRIPLPPLEEQKAIVHILSTVDEAIQKTNEVIEKIKRLKKGLMQELLTKGIGHKEFKDTEIGRIPKEWKVMKLGEVMRFENGRRPKIVLKKGKIPIYGSGGPVGYTQEFMVNQEFIVIVSRVGIGSVGKVYLARGAVWISDNAMYSKHYDSDQVYLPFIYYLLTFRRLERFILRSGAGSYAIITQSLLHNIKIQLPKVYEQRRIAEILLLIDKRLEVERKRKEKLERIKKALMDLLLTGKIRVKVS